MTNYKIVIPSYGRYETIENNALKMLKEQNIKKENIYIFIVEQEKELYEKIDKNLYNQLIIGEKGLINQLEFIRNYFNEGEKLVRIDDDVKTIFLKKYKKKELNNKTITRKQYSEIIKINLDEFIINAFNLLEEKKLSLFGVNKVSNTYLMTENITTDLRLICGNFYGFINKKDKKYDFIITKNYGGDGDDIETSLIRYINDGGILRFNEYGFLCGKYMAKGGIVKDQGNIDKRIINIKNSMNALNDYYKGYCTIKPDKKTGICVRLKRNPKIKIKI